MKRYPNDIPTIEDMAAEYFQSHPNDKSGRVLARMNRRFGRENTSIALVNMAKTIKMVDPYNPLARRFR
jgi:hypothetical protein